MRTMTDKIKIATCLWFNKNAEEAATQEETDRYWNAIVGGGGQESMCSWMLTRFARRDSRETTDVIGTSSCES